MAKVKHIKDDSRMQEARAKADGLQRQRTENLSRIKELQANQGSSRISPDIEFGARRLLLDDGGTAVAEVAPPSVELANARQHDQILNRSIELHAGQMRRLEAQLASEIHQERQAEHDAAALAIVQAIQQLWSATLAFESDRQAAAKRGAPYAPEQLLGTFQFAHIVGNFKLPVPQLADRTYRAFLQHLKMVHPRLSSEIASIIASMK